MKTTGTLNMTRLNLAFDGKPLGVLRRATNVVYRAKVPGGWLVFAEGGHGVGGVTFYPDPGHEWDGGTLD